MAVIGLDLGGTKIASAIFSQEGGILHQNAALLAGRTGSEVGAFLINQLQVGLNYAAAHQIHINAVGVSVPGIYNSGTGTVWAPNIPGWEHYPLLAELQTSLGEEMHIRIDSDRACHILGETWQGIAQGCSHAIFLAVGTGIGAGIMIDGVVLRGSRDIAGAIGWLALDRPYRAEYDACGCFEWHASGEGLVRVARQALAGQPEYHGMLREKVPEDLTAKDVFAAFDRGDPVATEVIENAIECWGMAVANLVSLFNPEQIIFGGGVFGPAARFLPEIRAEAEKWAQPVSMRQVRISASALEGKAGLYGTGKLALMALESTE